MKQVFIGGCGRSGTTFLGALIGRKTNFIVTPESQFKFDLLNRPNESGGQYLNWLENNWRFDNWGLDHNSLEKEMESVSNFPDFITSIVKEYGILHGIKKSNVWVDHTPNNIDHIIPIIRVFPDAKFIHLIRDGRGVAASVMPLSWGPNTIVSAADWWVRKLAIGLAAESLFGSERVMRVRYEDVIMNTSETLDSIFEFLGVEGSIDMTNNGSKMVLPEFTRKQHKFVNEQPNQSRISGWQNALTERQIEIFELKAMMLMQYLGYERHSKGNIKPIGTCESIRMRSGNLIKKYLKEI